MQGWRDDADFSDVSVECGLLDLGVLSLDLVTEAEDRRSRESMVETHHPAGWPGSIPQGGGRCPEPKSSGRGSRSRQTPSSA